MPSLACNAVRISWLVLAAMTLLSCSLKAGGEEVRLPDPRLEGEISVEAALAARRSVRGFRNVDMRLEALAQLSWAAQGISEPRRGFRTAPSAGALYPLELYVAVGGVVGLDSGLYHYAPERHSLVPRQGDDLRAALAKSAFGQGWIADAPVVFVIVGVAKRAEARYDRLGERFTVLEAGHAAQNIALQAVALGLGTTMVGAVNAHAVARTLGLEADHMPLYLIPAGTPR